MARSNHSYGIDIGGTKIELVACDDSLKVVHRKRVDTPTHNFDAFVEAIVALVHDADRQLNGQSPVGLGVPGVIDAGTGRHLSSNVPALNDRVLLSVLEERLQRDVVLGNDCQCFALSEARGGSAADQPSMFGAILGTGVGGGYCMNGKLLRGYNGLAGEWGHCAAPASLLRHYQLPVVKCSCGLTGCLERYISGKGLSFLYQQHAGIQLVSEVSASTIASRMATGDPMAKLVFDIHLDLLAKGLADLVLTLDPHVIVLGGGLSKLNHLYSDLPKAISGHLFDGVRVPPILPPTFGDAGGARGAALLARQQGSY